MKVPDISGIISIARTALDPKTQHTRDKVSPDTSSDQVELSSQGTTIQRIAAESSSPQARADEVAALKAAYAAGELKADALQTAQAMVGEGLFDDIIGLK